MQDVNYINNGSYYVSNSAELGHGGAITLLWSITNKKSKSIFLFIV